jgi:PAS domain S-box-containing protein
MNTPPIRVLIVDDEPAHVEAVRRALLSAETQIEVQVASSLHEFQEAVTAHAPDLVLLDLLLPDGRADTELISPPETGPFPMVVMTSHGDEQVAVSAIRRGALDYVVKSPEAFADMPRTVERTLRSWQAMQENRQAQEALREKERVLRLALDVGQIGAFEVELATGHATWSSAVKEIWGLPVEFGGDFPAYCWQHVHPDDLERVKRFYETLLQGNQEQELEFRLLRPDGTVRWLRWRGRVVRNEAGTGVRIVGVNQDITERRRLALEREEALIKYRTLFNALPLGITMANKQGKIIESNRVAKELLELSTEQQRPREIDGSEWKIVRPDGTPMPPDEYASVRALREGRIIHDVEMGLIKSPAETTWITVTAAPVPLPDVGVVIVYSDISARKRIQTKLDEQLNELRRWQEVMLNHSDRNQELKREVNELLRRLGEPVRYPSQSTDRTPAETLVEQENRPNHA